MGVVKLILPKFIYHRATLPANRNWVRNYRVGLVQVLTFGSLLYIGADRWRWSTPRRGAEVTDVNKKYAVAIKVL